MLVSLFRDELVGLTRLGILDRATERRLREAQPACSELLLSWFSRDVDVLACYVVFHLGEDASGGSVAWTRMWNASLGVSAALHGIDYNRQPVVCTPPLPLGHDTVLAAPWYIPRRDDWIYKGNCFCAVCVGLVFAGRICRRNFLFYSFVLC